MPKCIIYEAETICFAILTLILVIYCSRHFFHEKTTDSVFFCIFAFEHQALTLLDAWVSYQKKTLRFVA